MTDFFTRKAFLKYLQEENDCHGSGEPCSQRCFCELEMQDYIQAEKFGAAVSSPGESV